MESKIDSGRNIVLSIVVPAFNEELNVSEVFKRISLVFRKELDVSFEVIFVEDGSEDRTWLEIKDLRKKDNCARGIRFARNFGHQIAIRAGLDIAQGDAVITMDCDLQHPPKMITDMLKKWREGFLVVNTRKLETVSERKIKKWIVS